jgi:hypothetical protein
MNRETIIVAATLLLSACATGSDYAPTYTYNEFMVINNSKELIQNVTVKSADSDIIFSCESIAPLGVCQDRFTQRRYKERPFSIDWVFGDSVRQTNEVGVEVPAYDSPGVTLRAVLEISPEGAIKAYFKQGSGGR